MARISGRKGRVYLQIYTTDTAASPMPFVGQWSLNAATAKTDVTVMGDTNKTYISELPDASGTWGGFYDDASNQSYNAATDGIARMFYLYPDVTNASVYWFGTVLADISLTGSVSGAVGMSASWAAASPIIKKP